MHSPSTHTCSHKTRATVATIAAGQSNTIHHSSRFLQQRRIQSNAYEGSKLLFCTTDREACLVASLDVLRRKPHCKTSNTLNFQVQKCYCSRLREILHEIFTFDGNQPFMGIRNTFVLNT